VSNRDLRWSLPEFVNGQINEGRHQEKHRLGAIRTIRLPPIKKKPAVPHTAGQINIEEG
jgi:hypothetical protein